MEKISSNSTKTQIQTQTQLKEINEINLLIFNFQFFEINSYYNILKSQKSS